MGDEEHRPLSEHGPLSPGFEMRYMTLRGEKGEQGERGEQGEQGKNGTRLPIPQARAVVYLFIFSVAVSLVCLAGLTYYGHELSGQQQAVANQEQAVVREQREFVTSGQAAARKTCDTIAQILGIPAGHDSVFTKFETVERDRYRQLECRP